MYSVTGISSFILTAGDFQLIDSGVMRFIVHSAAQEIRCLV
jgi:hypothetical protein